MKDQLFLVLLGLAMAALIVAEWMVPGIIRLLIIRAHTAVASLNGNAGVL